MKRLPDIVQTMYSELVDLCLGEPLVIDGFPLSGSLVRDRGYVYHQSSRRTRDSESRRRSYVGREEDAKVRVFADAFSKAKERQQARRDLVSAIRKAAGPLPTGKLVGLLQALGDAGLLESALLMGTVCYTAYGPMLGVRLSSGFGATMDVDVADIGLAPSSEDGARDMQEVLSDFDVTFAPARGASPGPPTSYVSKGGIRVDVLAAMAGPEKPPAYSRSLGSHALGLRYLDYLAEETVRGVLLVGAGIPVVLPAPYRFAWHKVLVSRARPFHEKGKARKDIGQAATLFEVLLEDDPSEVARAYHDIISRGPKWRRRTLAGFETLPAEVRDDLAAVLKD